MPPEAELQIGEWQVRPSLNRLARDGETASLPSRFMDLLVFMARRPGEVVSKDEIIEAVWQKEFVSDGTLTHAVAALRQTLGDDPKQPRYIETIPTRGYRLIADVRALGGERGPADGPPPAAHRFPAWLVLLISLAAVGALAAAMLFRQSSAEPRSPTAGPLRLAVLPFSNLGTPDRAYLASGLTDDITTRLASVPGLGVVSHVSAENCAKTGRSASQIGAELGVQYLVTGSVRWQPEPDHGGQVWVNVQLVRAANDSHVWAASYDRPVESVFEIETNIASRVLEGIGIAVGSATQRRIIQRPTSDVDAYEAYLCGMRHLEFATREHLGLAASMFERAVELDPSFALGYAELGVVHSRFFQLHIDPTPGRLVLAKADIDRALALNPDLPEGMMALGAYYLYGLHDPERALKAFDRAASALPNDGELAALRVDAYRRQGRWDAALAESHRLVTVDPRNYAASLTLGETLSRLRRYVEADRAFEQAASFMPDNARPYLDRFENALRQYGPDARAERLLHAVPAPEAKTAVYETFILHYLRRDYAGALSALAAVRGTTVETATLVGPVALFRCLALAGLDDRAGVAASCREAMAALRRDGADGSADPRVHVALGYAAALLGRRDEALNEVDRANALCPATTDAFEGPAILGEAARIAALARARDRAIADIGRVMTVPGPLSASMLRSDPRFDELRHDPRFVALATATMAAVR
jgi:DNA-binding winged helix-turn-helix (wHTH) protein/TolB-like protein/TPR repeat protein